MSVQSVKSRDIGSYISYSAWNHKMLMTKMIMNLLIMIV